MAPALPVPPRPRSPALLSVAAACALACGDAGSAEASDPGTGAGPTSGDPPTSASGEPSTAGSSGPAATAPTTAGEATSETTGAGPTTAATDADATAASGEDSSTGAPAKCPPVSPTASAVCVEGRQLLVGRRVDGALAPVQPYAIEGVCWAPTSIGEANTMGYADYYVQYGGLDAPLIEALGANTLKTYDPFAQTPEALALLDDLHARGIMVAMSVIVYHGDAGPKNYLAAVDYFKDHPAILMWIVGNEFNYNNMYGAPDLDAATVIVNDAIAAIHAADPDHPVAVGHGEVPTPERYAAVPDADIWAINLYPALDLESRFVAWPGLSDKPMFVSEYGADAFNNMTDAEDQAAQAEATEVLTLQIGDHLSADDPRRACLGGTIYALTDEWWKAEGPIDQHDNGGFPGGVHPDGFANEEWWGLMDVARTPRQAYTALQAIYGAP
ncbi:MAG: hypothetical protein JNL82_05705 [Myxococcales bacterium]|nr:hypothetical protein [Myxococcales bacterium]